MAGSTYFLQDIDGPFVYSHGSIFFNACEFIKLFYFYLEVYWQKSFTFFVCEADLKILMLYVGWVEGMGDDGMRV